jgi:hypothetical protein
MVGIPMAELRRIRAVCLEESYPAGKFHRVKYVYVCVGITNNSYLTVLLTFVAVVHPPPNSTSIDCALCSTENSRETE